MTNLPTLRLPVVKGLNYRSYKNFGHKNEPIPGVTTLWHGFLTITFIGFGIEWKRIARLFLGDEAEKDGKSLDEVIGVSK